MDGRLEVVLIPVSDVDVAKAFYEETLGFVVDHDTRDGVPARLVQLTPLAARRVRSLSVPASPMPRRVPEPVFSSWSATLSAHAELAGRSVEVTPVQHLVGGEWRDGVGEPWTSFFFFHDPDGNPWIVQQGDISPRPPHSGEISTP